MGDVLEFNSVRFVQNPAQHNLILHKLDVLETDVNKLRNAPVGRFSSLNDLHKFARKHHITDAGFKLERLREENNLAYQKLIRVAGHIHSLLTVNNQFSSFLSDIRRMSNYVPFDITVQNRIRDVDDLIKQDTILLVALSCILEISSPPERR